MAKNFNNLNNKTMRKIFANAKSLLMGLVMVSAVTLSATSCSDQYDDSAIREEIEKLQLEALKKQIDNAFKTDFYKKKLTEAGINSSDDIKSLKDLKKIPVVC